MHVWLPVLPFKLSWQMWIWQQTDSQCIYKKNSPQKIIVKKGWYSNTNISKYVVLLKKQNKYLSKRMLSLTNTQYMTNIITMTGVVIVILSPFL